MFVMELLSLEGLPLGFVLLFHLQLVLPEALPEFTPDKIAHLFVIIMIIAVQVVGECNQFAFLRIEVAETPVEVLGHAGGYHFDLLT